MALNIFVDTIFRIVQVTGHAQVFMLFRLENLFEETVVYSYT